MNQSFEGRVVHGTFLALPKRFQNFVKQCRLNFFHIKSNLHPLHSAKRESNLKNLSAALIKPSVNIFHHYFLVSH